MSRLRLRFTLPALGVCLALAAVALFGARISGAAPAAAQQSAVVKKPTIITATAGKPSELAFKLSKTSSIPAGTITFKVTNMGVAYHDFKLCAKPVANPTAAVNACTGKSTAILKHGQSATLTVSIAKTGLYEYLCSVTGHAAAGMKGILGVGMAVTTAQQKAAAQANSTPASSTSGSSSRAAAARAAPAARAARRPPRPAAA